jgi:hypothetical protein
MDFQLITLLNCRHIKPNSAFDKTEYEWNLQILNLQLAKNLSTGKYYSHELWGFYGSEDFRLCDSMICYVVTNISEKLVASIFRAENGGISFLQNVVTTYPTIWCYNLEDHNPNTSITHF